MSPRTRSLAALGLTLLIGLVLGLLLGTRLASQRIDRLGTMVYPPRMLAMLHENLALNDQQRMLVDSLLESQATLLSSRFSEHRLYMRDQMDSLMQNLRPHLTNAQWDRLQTQLASPPRRGRPGWCPQPDMGPAGGKGPGRGRGWRHGNRRAGGDSLLPPPPPAPAREK